MYIYYIPTRYIVIYTFDLSGGIREIALRIFPRYPVPINNNNVVARVRPCVRSLFFFWYFNFSVFTILKAILFYSTLSTLFIV